jgi:hypothetical protein
MIQSNPAEITNREYDRLQRIRIKAKYNFTCAKCGTIENIQAHAPNGDHTKWEDGIALCGECHADKHPDVPRGLFLTPKLQPCWPNISAASLAQDIGCHSRTIIRRAKRLAIPIGLPLSNYDIERLRVCKLNIGSKQKYPTIRWSKELVREGFIGKMQILDGVFIAVVIHPAATLEQVKKSLEVRLKDVELRIEKEKTCGPAGD